MLSEISQTRKDKHVLSHLHVESVKSRNPSIRDWDGGWQGLGVETRRCWAKGTKFQWLDEEVLGLTYNVETGVNSAKLHT